jgi:hypothetical protein
VRGSRAGAKGVCAIGNHWLEEVATLAPEEEAAGDAIVESGAVVEEVDDAVRPWVVTGTGVEAVTAAAVGSVFDLAMCAGIGTLEVASV